MFYVYHTLYVEFKPETSVFISIVLLTMAVGSLLCDNTVDDSFVLELEFDNCEQFTIMVLLWIEFFLELNFLLP